MLRFKVFHINLKYFISTNSPCRLICTGCVIYYADFFRYACYKSQDNYLRFLAADFFLSLFLPPAAIIIITIITTTAATHKATTIVKLPLS